jgi:ethanolamine transporter EutH
MGPVGLAAVGLVALQPVQPDPLVEQLCTSP